MTLHFELFGSQIDGARDYQEDSFLTSHQNDHGEFPAILSIVSDGMGGHAAGHIASNLAVQAFNKHLSSNFQTYDIPALMVNALDDANEAIRNTISETAALKGMGCTLIATLCIDNKLYYISVGDSHLYLLSSDGRTIKKVNDDHSYGGYLDRMAEEGNDVSDENSYSRHMLLSAITGEAIPAVDCPEMPLTLEKGDKLILCSDGMDTLDHDDILSVNKKSDSVKEMVEKLLVSVTNAQTPRQDNTTVIILEAQDLEADKEEEENVEIIRPSPPPQTVIEPSSSQGRARKNTRHPNNNTRKKKGSPLFAIIGLMILIGIGGWWYLTQANSDVMVPSVVSNIVESTKSRILGSDDPGNTEIVDDEITEDTEPIFSSNSSSFEEPLSTEKPVTTEESPFTEKMALGLHEISYFRDNLGNGSRGPEMVWVPSGSFKMGSSSATSLKNQRPGHKVSLKEFAISSKEISLGEFSQFTGKSVSILRKDLPVRGISWHSAQRYVKWLSRETGRRYRLPSEAEWEYAARAGTTSPYWWGHTLGHNKAVCVGCGDTFEPAGPAKTGSFAANAFGLYDTVGNVSEWVQDCYHDNYDDAPSDGASWVSDRCPERVYRGGSFTNAGKVLYVSRRHKLKAGSSRKDIGLRVVREK